ncbi:hypothetical protein RHSIM_Rhsim12G0012600 [Rhododendron simsii]|uniref:Uncharacterized protein n=1 Tax=Rhododendron simsii TaxID=118357 RepID=A0A834G5J0_RHOSS|nr:hypothetical protein RHSIM_Rhsim12G0012600 [Rhododendron simsii]
MAAASPSSSMVPDSDPREYRPPPPHEFEPVGLKFYKPKRNTFDSGLVLQEPEIHFSGKDREGEDAATFSEEGGDYEEYRVKRLMPTFGARLPSQRPRARAVPTATGGEGAEVLGVASLEELPQLPEQVIYFSRRGQLRSDDIPSPDHVELALPPSVHEVSREYVEACFCCISGLSALVRKKSMVIEDLEARLSVDDENEYSPIELWILVVGNCVGMRRQDVGAYETKELGSFYQIFCRRCTLRMQSQRSRPQLIPSQGRGKRHKTTAPPRSARRTKIVPPVESTMAPPPAQDSLFALASSNSISGIDLSTTFTAIMGWVEDIKNNLGLNSIGLEASFESDKELWTGLWDRGLISAANTEGCRGFSYDKCGVSTSGSDEFEYCSCKSSWDAVQNDPLLWRSIQKDGPLNSLRITIGELSDVVERNQGLAKLRVPGCVRLGVDGILCNLSAAGMLGIKHLSVGRLYGFNSKQFEDLKRS